MAVAVAMEAPVSIPAAVEETVIVLGGVPVWVSSASMESVEEAIQMAVSLVVHAAVAATGAAAMGALSTVVTVAAAMGIPVPIPVAVEESVIVPMVFVVVAFHVLEGAGEDL
jgi:hypothetical protein